MMIEISLKFYSPLSIPAYDLKVKVTGITLYNFSKLKSFFFLFLFFFFQEYILTLTWKQLMQFVGQTWLNLVTWTCGS